MPRRRQVLRRRDDGRLSAAQREQLLTGLDFSCLDAGFETDADLEAAWEAHWSELLDYWTQTPGPEAPHGEFGAPRPGGPGTRPWAWWRFEAPEPRQMVSGKGKPLEHCPVSFGMPTQWIELDSENPPIYESEYDYLARLDLLGEGEESGAVAAPWSGQPGGAVLDYALKVTRREIAMGRRVTSACQRQLDDWRDAHARGGYYWCEESARHLYRWFDFFRCSVGEWDGELLQLQPSQAFSFLTSMAWMRSSGKRRFRRVMIFVSRKFGKSTLVGAFGLYGLVADGEAGAQVYSVALDGKQARIIYDEAVAFAESQPHLAGLLKMGKDEIECGRGKFQPLTKGPKNKLGFNPHYGLVDEYLAFKTDEAVSVIQTGMGSRTQPMMLFISTAGDNAEGPCYSEWSYACQIVDGALESDDYFAYLCEVDIPEELEEGGKKLSTEKTIEFLIEHPETWIQAAPCLGLTPKVEFLEEQLKLARDRPDLAAEIIRLNFNRWVIGSSEAWWKYHFWEACGDQRGEMELREQLKAKRCYGAVDLASIDDLTAFGLFFPDEMKYLCWHWCPEGGLSERVKLHGVRYDRWVEQGWIETTSGNCIDFDHIRDRIIELSELYQIEFIGHDKWNVLQMVGHLENKGLKMVEIGRSAAALDPASKALQRLVLDNQFSHGNNPVLNWQASHVEVLKVGRDIRPVRPQIGGRYKKIDGIIALVMALCFHVRAGEKRGSVYDKRGVRSVN